MDKISVFEKICLEIESGPFSIMSEKAKNEIKGWVRFAMADGYERGLQEGRQEKRLDRWG